jgi:DNA-binding beta-propeller fold protein YncE
MSTMTVNKNFKLASFLLCCLLLFSLAPLALPRPARAAETYEFVNLWGGLDAPEAVAVDQSDNVYVADSGNQQIQKFNSNGGFITKWGTLGAGPSEFANPGGIAVDQTGNVYVADSSNHRVQKFTSTGGFIGQWGEAGSEDGQLLWPGGIAVDQSGNVYVADRGNNRVQKFNSTGGFITKWGSFGWDNGEFIGPSGIAADQSGNVYVASYGDGRIQKFTSSGGFITKWGTSGTGNGELYLPYEVAVDQSGNVYVADSDNHRIQKFTSNGGFITKWGTLGSSNGKFSGPLGVAVDQSGNVYVADTSNHRIQKFQKVVVMPPFTALTTNPSTPDGNNGWFKTNPTITLTPNRTTTTKYRWGSGSWQTYSGSFTAPLGQNTLSYYSTDAGGTETTKQQAFKVDSVKPSTVLTAPAISTNVSKTTTFKVKWSGADTLSGVASYDVQYKLAGRSWQKFKTNTTATSAAFKGIAGNSYYFRAITKDKAGNLSAWSKAKRTIVPYDNDSLIAARSGFGWTAKNTSSGLYLGTTRYSTKKGHKITYKFTGKSVALIGPKASSRSKAKIYINGNYVKTIDAFASTLKHRQVLFSKTWSSSGTRTITIENLGTAGRTRFDVDGLGVGR